MYTFKKSAMKYKDANGVMQDAGVMCSVNETDTTLTKSGVAADAKISGEKFNKTNTDITDLNRQVKVERERINTFTALGEGSTTGDAELADARVDKDGTTHANVGEHIRTVTNELNENLVNIAEKTPEIMNVSLYEKGSLTSGANSTYNEQARARSKELEEYPYEVTIKPNNSDNLCYAVCFYDDDGTFANETEWLDSAYTIKANQKFRLILTLNYTSSETASLEDIVGFYTIEKGYPIYQDVRYKTNSTEDCTDDIVAILNEKGYVELDSGDYYISNLTMPNNSMVRGQGKSTRLIVHDYRTHGIIMTKGCSIDGVQIVGMASTYADTKGDSAGIYITGEDIYNVKIHNCTIYGFNLGGIYITETGYWCACSVTASSCEIYHCYAGIYCDISAEYSRFTNIICHDNNKGCENNGGNNVFVNCTFSNNIVGFQIDGTAENAVNLGHGSCVGCTFNHSNNNDGYAIIINTNPNGFVFSGCQIWYGKIFIEQSKGIIFNGCEMGGSIELLINWITGILLLANCLFNVSPTKTFANDGSKTYTIFNSCYLFDGTAITTN